MARFRPSPAATIGLLSVAAACLWLASWQWQRGSEKADRQQAFADAPAHTGLPPGSESNEFARVAIAGRFDTQRHLLADNQVLNGRAGVHVYTPFQAKGGQQILVNRGWLPLPPSRSPMPTVPTPDGVQTIEGRLGRIPGPGRQLGEAQPPEANRWPALVTYLTIETAEASLQAELYPWVLLLEKNQPSGFDGRDWRPVYMTAQKHRGYAAQWLALALASLVYWLLAGFRRGKGGFQ